MAVLILSWRKEHLKNPAHREVRPLGRSAGLAAVEVQCGAAEASRRWRL